jgi:hypothetical protein
MAEQRNQLSKVDQLFHTGNIWRLKGNIANAEANYKQILEQDPKLCEGL